MVKICPNISKVSILIFGFIVSTLFLIVYSSPTSVLADEMLEMECPPGSGDKGSCFGTTIQCINGNVSCAKTGVGGDPQGYIWCDACEGNYQTCYHPDRPSSHEIRWCGGGSGPQGNCIPDAVQDAPLSCDGGPGSFNQMDGFLYKQYGKVNIDDEYET